MRPLYIAGLVACCTGIASASAADLPRVYNAAAPQVATRATDWTGAYVGVQSGYGWGQSSGTQSAGSTFFPVVPYSIDPHGFVGGGHVGYNRQFGSAVFGLEGDIEAAHIDGMSTVEGFGATRFFNVKADALASIRGRAGWSWQNWLIYGTGGIAFGHVKSPPFDALNGWRTGWTAGAGVERALAGRLSPWRVRLEYRYTDLGDKSSFDPAFGTTDNNTLSFHAVRAGISYKFAGPR
jgi:outer membrane immunogenic protein